MPENLSAYSHQLSALWWMPYVEDKNCYGDFAVRMGGSCPLARAAERVVESSLKSRQKSDSIDPIPVPDFPYSDCSDCPNYSLIVSALEVISTSFPS